MAKSSQFYTNKDIKYLVNRRIVEWDIQRAGLQALCNMGIISEDTHEYWKSRDKHWSSIYVGKNLAAKMKDQNQKYTTEIITNSNAKNDLFANKKFSPLLIIVRFKGRRINYL